MEKIVVRTAPVETRDQDKVRTGGESPSFGPVVMPRGNR
jgi:hypothetical protein